MLQPNAGYQECGTHIKDIETEKNSAAENPSVVKKTKKRNIKVNVVDICDLSPKEKELYASLNEFFTEDILKDIIIPIKQQQWSISLRTLDYLLTAFAGPHNVQYYRSQDEQFPWNLYRSYKKMLEHGGPKKKFDPFCRGNRIIYRKGNVEVKTTLAQLNFFRWAIKNDVLKWADEHAEEIQNDIDKNSKKTKRTKRAKTTNSPKRQKLQN